MKYRLKSATESPVDMTFADTAGRVAKAVAAAEKAPQREHWESQFFAALINREFLPGGRILAGAGGHQRVTLFNCFVMGRIDDDLGAIFQHVKEAAQTMQAGGGIGHDFSSLRPNGAPVQSIGATASGPIAFMDVWDAMCRSVMSAGARRGAMMGTLRCDHPDIEAFIDVKRDPHRLRNFNLSVLVTDAFVNAIRTNAPWPLVFEGKTYRTISARDLWQRLMRATYDVAEPGVIFIDRINGQNNLAYCETINATNPCGEQPLPAYGACLLGAINLAFLVRDPFSKAARIDESRLVELVTVATRFLDNVIDVSSYPLPAQKHEALSKRRIGLGVTGLADALIMLGVRYGSDKAVELTGRWLGQIKHAAYSASAGLAEEKGAFSACDSAALVDRPNLKSLPHDLRERVAHSGLRNGVLTTIAPTGTTSLLAGNVSSGIEPVFDFSFNRKITAADGSRHEQRVEDYAYHRYRQMFGPDRPLTDAFVTVSTLTPADHLVMQAAAQAHVDSAISKTVNCPEAISFSNFESIYLDAYDKGLKGCTTYRPNSVTGSILTADPQPRSQESARDAIAVAVTPAAIAPVLTRTVDAAVAAQSPRGTLNPTGGDVIYMSKPLARDPVLGGYTYKLKWPRSEHAIYITINDIEHEGRRRPFEIFINSKNLEHTAWTLALTRMISAVFRRGGDFAFVVEELKAVFDPQGGAWMNGHYVPSLLAAIGGVIETHLARTTSSSQSNQQAATQPPPFGDLQMPARQSYPPEIASAQRIGIGENIGIGGLSHHPPGTSHDAGQDICPRCHQSSLIHQDGCALCRNCGYSRCN